jgi:hypothetical protein
MQEKGMGEKGGSREFVNLGGWVRKVVRERELLWKLKANNPEEEQEIRLCVDDTKPMEAEPSLALTTEFKRREDMERQGEKGQG